MIRNGANLMALAMARQNRLQTGFGRASRCGRGCLADARYAQAPVRTGIISRMRSRSAFWTTSRLRCSLVATLPASFASASAGLVELQHDPVVKRGLRRVRGVARVG